MSNNTKIIWYLAFAVVIGVILNNTMHLYYLWMPASHWVEYEKIELIEPAYVGERLRFVSYRTIHNKVGLSFANDLMCWDGDRGTYEFYEKQRSSNPTPENGPATWYFKEIVNVEKSCYLHANIILNLHYDVRKVITLDSPKFNISRRDT